MTLCRCSSFTASEGAAYCRANGMTAVSLDSDAKEREFGNLLVRWDTASRARDFDLTSRKFTVPGKGTFSWKDHNQMTIEGQL